MAKIVDRAKKVRYLLKHEGPICHYCGTRLATEPDKNGRPLENQVTLDHIVPRSRGGGDHLENFVLSCPGCNQWKGRELYEKHCARCRERFAAVAEKAAERSAKLAAMKPGKGAFSKSRRPSPRSPAKA
jgi:hypothetical protein